MALDRARHFSVVLLLVTIGCATPSNTLQQDMAWDAWNSCPKSANIRLDRIDPNGMIYYSGLNGSAGMTELSYCIKNYYANRATSKAVPSTPQGTVVPAALSVAPNSTPGVPATPTWKPGYEWAYRYESPSGSGTYVWSVDREEAIDGVPHYVVKSGTRELFYRKSDFAETHETLDGAVVVKYTPAHLYIMWPLQVGQTWEQTYQLERPAARQTSERVDAFTVEAEETITVPAGTFKTLKVVCRNKKNGRTRYEGWYSLDLKQVVKLRENLEAGTRIRELIAFKLR